MSNTLLPSERAKRGSLRHVEMAFNNILGQIANMNVALRPDSSVEIDGEPALRGSFADPKRGREVAVWVNHNGVILGGKGRLQGDLLQATKSLAYDLARGRMAAKTAKKKGSKRKGYQKRSGDSLGRMAMMYFSVSTEDYNIEEDADNGDAFAQSLSQDGGRGLVKLEGDALKKLSRLFGQRIGNEGHNSYGDLVCKFGVNSWADVKKANDVISRNHVGGDDQIDTGVQYVVAQGFDLYPNGVNDDFYGSGQGAEGDLEEWLDDHKPGRAARFTEGPKGEKEFDAWMKRQPKEVQEDWKQNTDKYKDKFSDEESMMEKTDDAPAMLPVEVEMQRLAARPHRDDLAGPTTDEPVVSPSEAADFSGEVASALARIIGGKANPGRVIGVVEDRDAGKVSLVSGPAFDRKLRGVFAIGLKALWYRGGRFPQQGFDPSRAASFWNGIVARDADPRRVAQEIAKAYKKEEDFWFRNIPKDASAEHRTASRLQLKDLYELDPKGELDDAGYEKLLRALPGRNPERELQVADDMLRTHGVESIDEDPEDYHSDPFASYLNTGDLYNVTLAWVYPRRKWEVTTAADLRQEAESGRFASMLPVEKQAALKQAAGGLYGFTKQTQKDVEVSVRKAQKQAAEIARTLYAQDSKSVSFLQAHAARTGSASAKLILAAMKDFGPKLASEVAKEGAARKPSGMGLYGFPSKTARQCLSACTGLRAHVGEVGFSLHSRRQAKWEKITAFMRTHSKKAKCAHTQMILGCYPDAPASDERIAAAEGAWWNPNFKPKAATVVKGAKLMKNQEKVLQKYLDGGGDASSFDDLPSKVQSALSRVKDQETLHTDVDRWLGDNNNPHLKGAKQKAPPKEHQFTSENNPNPKGSDADGDGKKNEPKPFKEAAGEFVLRVTKGKHRGSYQFQTPEEAVSAAGDHAMFSDKDKAKGIGLLKDGKPWSVESRAGAFTIRPPKGKKAKVASGAVNARYLASIPAPKKADILKAVAKHYGVSVREIEGELIDPEAEELYEYLAFDNRMAMQVYRDFQQGRFAAKEAAREDDIGKKEKGALKNDSDESYMGDNFTEQENSELREKQESGKLASSKKLVEKAKKLLKGAEEGSPEQMALKVELANIAESDSPTTRNRLENAIARAEKHKKANTLNSVEGWLEWEV